MRWDVMLEKITMEYTHTTVNCAKQVGTCIFIHLSSSVHGVQYRELNIIFILLVF